MSAKHATLMAALLLIATPVDARNVRGNLSDVTSIVHESGVGRVLFHADVTIPEVPAGIAVRRAVLRIPVSNSESSRATTVRVHPVTTA